MALTATMLLATFAVLDSMAVPLASDGTTDVSSMASASVTSSWVTDAASSSALTMGPAAVSTTSSVTGTDSPLTSQSSTSASETGSLPSSSSPYSTTSSSSVTPAISTVYATAPTVTVTGPPQTVTDTITIVPPPTPAPTITQTAWSAPPQMTDLSAFNVQNFAYGNQNMRIILSAPASTANSSDISSESLSKAQMELASAADAGMIPSPPDANASAFLQLFYPANSINPAQEPQGGADFYATPLDLNGARNVSLEYSVFFPADFDFVQAGKLPGIYGGHDGCSGGDDALECFSTRLMWRAKGLGELYLYAPKDKQTAALCSTPPQSVCDADWGLSVGRGAFSFTPGNWTHVKQTVTLNTPGKQDGGFALDVNGKRVIERCDVYYRGAPQAEDSDSEAESAIPIASPPVAAGAQQEFIKGPFHLKVDSVVKRDGADAPQQFTPDFAPPTPFSPFASGPSPDDNSFTPAFAPPPAPAQAGSPDDIKLAETAAESATTTAASTVTVTPAPQTVTVYPTSTETSYAMAMQSSAPAAFAAASVGAPPPPIGFTGLFFSTFFGGHEPKYATPKDQFTWFKDFAMTINA